MEEWDPIEHGLWPIISALFAQRAFNVYTIDRLRPILGDAQHRPGASLRAALAEGGRLNRLATYLSMDSEEEVGVDVDEYRYNSLPLVPRLNRLVKMFEQNCIELQKLPAESIYDSKPYEEFLELLNVCSLERERLFEILQSIDKGAADLPPLTPAQQAVFDLIRKNGPITGRAICDTLGGNDSALRKYTIPELKRRGVKRSGAGYYLDM